MRAIAPLLLYLLSALVEVHSQTTPYLTIMGKTIPNNSYVNVNALDTKRDAGNSHTLQCHTDLNICCTPAQGPDRGDWYFPNGSRLPFYKYMDTPVLSEGRGPQRVDVYHRGSVGTFGIYRCDIETIAVNNNSGNVSLFVGLYTSGGE